MTEPDLKPMKQEDEKTSRKHHTPDKGWAWVIAFAGMLNLFITVGIYRSLGMLLVELMEVFDAPAAKFSLIFTSVASGFCACAIAYILGIGQIIHERALVLVSGLFGSVAFLLTYFYTRLEGFYITGVCVGVMAQIGMSSSLGMVGKYFHKRLSIGNGIVMSGVSIGTISLPTVVQFLYDEYTYRGAGIIIAGFILNTFVCAFLMRPAEVYTPGADKRLSQTDKKGKKCDQRQVHHPHTPDENSDLSEFNGVFQQTGPECPHFHMNDVLERQCTTTGVNGTTTDTCLTSDFEGNKQESGPSVVQSDNQNGVNFCDIKFESNKRNESETVIEPIMSNIISVTGVSNPSFVPDIDEPGVEHKTVYESKVHEVTNKSNGIILVLKKFAFVNNKHKPKNTSGLQTVFGGLLLFKNVSFVFFQLFCIFSTLGCECLIQFFPAFIKDSGMSSYHSAFLLSVIGGSDLVARILLGFLGDYISRDVLVLVPQFILAMVCFLAGFATETWSQVILAVLIGLNYGCTYSFRGVLLLDYFGLEHLSQTLGISNFMGSLGFTFGSPLMGYFRDITGTYVLSIQALGVIFLFSFISFSMVTMTKLCGRLRTKSYDLDSR